jgi:heptaprenyl diphosphate synthase
MILLKNFDLFSNVGVSVAGGICHNAGQIIAACIVMKTSAISVYFIPLVISGTVSGVLIGVVSGMLVERLKKIIK